MYRFLAGLVATVLAVLCMGQGCPTLTANRPISETGISAGTYSGIITCTATQKVYSVSGGLMSEQPVTVTPTNTVRSFGESGRLLTAQGTDVGPGDYLSGQIGPFSLTYTTNSAQTGGGRETLVDDLVITLNTGSQTIRFTGPQTRTFTSRADGAIDESHSFDAFTQIIDGEFAELKESCSGTLVKQ